VSAEGPAGFGTSPRFEPARPGDVCVLLAPRVPPPAATSSRIAELRRRLGGTPVEPLHITCERFLEGGDVAALVTQLATRASQTAPFAVRGASLFRWQPPEYDHAVLKYLIEETPDLAAARSGVREAARAAGMRSAYGGETEYTVTLLRGVADAPLPASDPCDLFVAEGFLVSRIAGPDRFETLAFVDFARR
jgi:hypothetical protein